MIEFEPVGNIVISYWSLETFPFFFYKLNHLDWEYLTKGVYYELQFILYLAGRDAVVDAVVATDVTLVDDDNLLLHL